MARESIDARKVEKDGVFSSIGALYRRAVRVDQSNWATGIISTLHARTDRVQLP